MRNVVTLSDIPKDLHDWLKKEATRRSKSSGKRVGISQVVTQAVSELKKRDDNHPRRRGIVIPKMEIFRKRIKPAEQGLCLCTQSAAAPLWYWKYHYNEGRRGRFNNFSAGAVTT